MLKLETGRLLLRPLEAGDAPAITGLIGDYDVTKNLSRSPHPYRESDAHEFLERVSRSRASGEGFVFVILRKADGVFMGTIGLDLRNGRFELGYWLGKPFWGLGFTTEAARKLLSFAFRELKAMEVTAGWFYDNPASGRVLEKLGFKPCGGEMIECRARGESVYCNRMTLTREDFGRKKAPFDGLRVRETHPSC